jgi:long-subunit fatty acid transport protein
MKLFASLGWTLKGDPDGLDFRNPWFGSLGFSHQLSDANTWGAVYDYRQKLTPHGAPISEATLFLTRKYSKQWKVQGYLVGGFSDASPDRGLGSVVSYTY